MRRLAAETGRPITYGFLQHDVAPDDWERLLEVATEAHAEGIPLHPQITGRPIGMLLGLQGFNPFVTRPTYLALRELPLAERVAELRKPAGAGRHPLRGRPRAPAVVHRHGPRPHLRARRPARLRARPRGLDRRRGRPPRPGALRPALRHAPAPRGPRAADAPARRLQRPDHGPHPRDAPAPGHGARRRRRRGPRERDLRRQHADLHAHPLGPRPLPGAEAPDRDGRAQDDQEQRRPLRLLRPGRHRSRPAGRPQRDRPRSPHAPRPGVPARPAERRPAPRAGGRGLRGHPRGGHRDPPQRHRHRRPPRRARPLRRQQPRKGTR